jgi:1,4-alpha-glucan branching enzyme
VRDLYHRYRELPALWERDDDHEAFGWLEANDADANVLAFVRWGEGDSKPVVVIANLSPMPREGYRVGLPRSGKWAEVLNTDAGIYGGSNVGNMGGVEAEAQPWHDQPFSATVTLAPLGVVWLVPAD